MVKQCLEEDGIHFKLLNYSLNRNLEIRTGALNLRLANRKLLLQPKYQLLHQDYSLL
jgi:hypothetical protein